MVKVVRGKNFQSSALFRCLPVTSTEICPSRFKNKVQYSKATPHQKNKNKDKKKTKTKTKKKQKTKQKQNKIRQVLAISRYWLFQVRKFVKPRFSIQRTLDIARQFPQSVGASLNRGSTVQ